MQNSTAQGQRRVTPDQVNGVLSRYPITASLIRKYAKARKAEVIAGAMLARVTEEKISQLCDDGAIQGSVHLSIGQEWIDADMVYRFDRPLVFGNHRSHGQYLAATGGDVVGLLRQVRDGMSQHLYAPNLFMSTGIQAGLVPVAFGVAQAFKRHGSDRQVICFVGDGTMGQGAFWETWNLLQINTCHLLVVVLDNGYQMGPGFGSVTQYVNGRDGGRDVFDDPEYVFTGRPTSGVVLSCPPRLCGHSNNDTQTYRPKEELSDEWFMAQDALTVMGCYSPHMEPAWSEIREYVDAAWHEVCNG